MVCVDWVLGVRSEEEGKRHIGDPRLLGLDKQRDGRVDGVVVDGLTAD